jgi:hypothetical protein
MIRTALPPATIPFRLVALPLERFAHLFSVSDSELLNYGARRCIVDAKPGYPCRVSLADAELGERVILLPFTHHDTASPYQGSGPIFVREQVERAFPGVNEVPEMIRRRLLSIRAYDAAGMMLGAEVSEGNTLEDQIQRFFANAAVAYLHVHNARPGCYNCRVDRA